LGSIFLVYANSFAQNKKQIDSINILEIQLLQLSPDSLVNLFKKNIQDAEAIQYEEGVAKGYTRLGLVYGYQGKYDEATNLTFKAINKYEQLNMPIEVALLYAGMGYSLKYSDLKKGLSYMQKGISVAEKNNLQDELKDIYNNYGVLKEINNELDSALYYYNKGLQIKIAQNNTFDIPYSISNIAGVYALKKEYEKAKQQYNKSLQDRIILQDSIGIAENYTQIGEVYMAEEKYNEAIQYIKKSLPISLKKEYQNLTQYNYKLLSDIFKNLKNTDSALTYFEKYVAVKDSVHNIKVQEKIATLSVEFETEKKENEILKQRSQLAEKELEVKRKNTFIYGSLGLAFLLGFLGYLFYNQQKLKNRQLQKEGELKTALAKIETQNRLQEQRLRISRDLHDNIGAQLTFIISSIDNIKYGFTEISDKLSQKLYGISSFTSQTIYELRDTIWAMNKNNINWEDLQGRITNFIKKAQTVSDSISFSFQVASEIDQEYVFTSIEGMNIYRIIQEAVNNALKYADAKKIKVDVSEEKNYYVIETIDDGNGFDIENVALGNGINNIKKRARDIGAEVDIYSTKGKGTSVLLRMPKVVSN